LTLDVARADLSESWAVFRDDAAPAPVLRGFLLVAAGAIWVSVFVADWAAFRLWVPFEAIVPASTLFVFGSMLGADRNRIAHTVVFLLATLTYLLVQRVARQQTASTWLVADIGPGSSALLRAGSGLGVVAVLCAVIAGPLLPGSHSKELFGWRDLDNGPDSRQTISPLVQIKSRLTNQSLTEVFTVEANERSYWRLTALDDFDGSVWASKGSYGEASGELPESVSTDASVAPAVQVFTIEALSAIWLPAAFEPKSVEGENLHARWEPDSATLIVDTDQTTSDGLTYTIQSAIPRFDPGALDATSAATPDAILRRDLALPAGFSDAVRDVAADVTKDATTPYAQALALQDWFRDNFTYDLDAPSGHSDDAVAAFVLETRRGYCEQFAGSYAAMARSIGLPARVAVGFTPGERDTEGVYHVRGEHAHAWPEVYLGDAGWVPFEPTPGRGAPGALSYTGVPEQQAATGDPGSATTVSAVPTTGGGEGIGSTTFTLPDDLGADFGTSGGTAAGENHTFVTRVVNTVLWVLAIAVAAGLVLSLVYACVVLWWRRHRRNARRRKAEAPVDRVLVAWDESTEAVSVLGLAPRRAETYAEFAARAATMVDGDAVRGLAGTATAAEYSDDGVDDDDADRAWEWSGEIREQAHAQTTLRQRAQAALDPRTLSGSPRAIRRRVRATEREDDERLAPVRAGR
jgi:transglutaminase-like putative cysteine protease